MRSIRGFTLIELLVAISIMAAMTLIAWRSVDGMTQSVGQAQQHSDDVLALQSGLDQWVLDLEAIQITPETRSLSWDGRSLRITRRHSSDPAQGLSVVAWALRKTPNGSMWSRWQSPAVHTRAEWRNAWQAASDWAKVSSTETRQLDVAVAQLEQWQVLFFSNGVWSPPPLDAEGSPSPDFMNPNGVRLVLSIANDHPLGGVIQRDWVRPTLTGSAR